MQLCCPQCQNPIELADVPSNGEITCAGCGSSFHVDPYATRSVASAEGKRLGKFELLSWLGQGAFGSVFKARDNELDRVVAIKVPRTGSLGSSGDSDRFLRDARSVAQLRHPSIVPVFEIGQDSGVPYLALLWDSLLRAQEGDILGALRSCRCLLNSGRVIGDEPILGSQLVRMALTSMTLGLVENSLARGESDEAEMASLQAALAAEADHPRLRIMARADRGAIDWTLSAIAAGDFSPADVAKEMKKGGSPTSTWNAGRPDRQFGGRMPRSCGR